MPSSFTLLKSSIQIFLDNYKLFLLIIAAPIAFNFVVAFFEPDPNSLSLGNMDFGFLALYFGLLLISIGVTVFMSIALIHAVANTSLTVTDAYKMATKQFFKYLGLAIVMGVMIIIGFILLVVPGIWLSVALSFSVYFLILQGKGIKESLSASKALVKGKWWDVAVKMFFLSVIGFVFVFVLGILSGIFAVVRIDATVTNAIISCLGMLLTPIGNIYLYQMFVSLQANTEAISVTDVATPAV